MTWSRWQLAMKALGNAPGHRVPRTARRDALDLLVDLQAAGASLTVESDDLRIRGPMKVQTPALLARVKALKVALLAIVRDRDRWAGSASDPLVRYAETVFGAPVREIRPHGTPLESRLAGRPWRSKMAIEGEQDGTGAR